MKNACEEKRGQQMMERREMTNAFENEGAEQLKETARNQERM